MHCRARVEPIAVLLQAASCRAKATQWHAMEHVGASGSPARSGRSSLLQSACCHLPYVCLTRCRPGHTSSRRVRAASASVATFSWSRNNPLYSNAPERFFDFDGTWRFAPMSAATTTITVPAGGARVMCDASMNSVATPSTFGPGNRVYYLANCCTQQAGGSVNPFYSDSNMWPLMDHGANLVSGSYQPEAGTATVHQVATLAEGTYTVGFCIRNFNAGESGNLLTNYANGVFVLL